MTSLLFPFYGHPLFLVMQVSRRGSTFPVSTSIGLSSVTFCLIAIITALDKDIVELQPEVADVEWRSNGNDKFEMNRMFLVEYKNGQRQTGKKCINCGEARRATNRGTIGFCRHIHLCKQTSFEQPHRQDVIDFKTSKQPHGETD